MPMRVVKVYDGKPASAVVGTCQHRQALLGGHGQRLERTALDVLQRRLRQVEHHLQTACQQVEHGLRGALVLHVVHLHVRRLGELLGRQMQRVAGAGRAVVDLARVRLRIGHELLQVGGRELRRHHHHERRFDEVGHAREVLGGVERQLGVQRAQRAVRELADQVERVAIGLGLGHVVGADDGVAAGLVLHHHAVVHALANLLGV
jgi:hypothetical protein